MNLEKIIADLKGISVFEHNTHFVSHIKDTLQYPKNGIKDAIYYSYTSREWSSDDDCPGQGAGDWYECERITKQYFFVEKISDKYKIVDLSMGNSAIVNDVKISLETKGCAIEYIIARETVDGPNWRWFNDSVYILGEIEHEKI